jgi:DNA mismatch endonuclease (patch repair protein)
MDKITVARRSANMRAIKSNDTLPELAIRRIVYGLGYRYRLRYPLPGKPDLTFVGRKKVIFVHGCFWHQHGCSHVRPPKSNQSYWEPKLARTKERDLETQTKLAKLGWKALVIWECELSDIDQVTAKIDDFLFPNSLIVFRSVEN